MQSEEENGSPEQEGEERIPKPRRTNKQLGEMLSLRETLKAKKPEFNRQESWRYKRVKPSWRRARGLDSKMRTKRKGWPKSVDHGYRSPKSVRGLHPSGFEDVIVHNVKDLDEITSDQAARIGHTVGRRKRADIVERAEELKIYVLNKRVRPVETY
ncbi:MAG: 50S ribosomal protein L32e [Candidatus Bathyarchaeota archaeon]|nr:50S ribosomal protein L32e [Candidatus Bathyarchaeota archaeon]